MHIFELNTNESNPRLAYIGTGLRHTLLVGPGRPEDGHVQLIPQVRYSPEPPPDGVCLVVVRGPLYGQSCTGLTIYGGATPERVPAIQIGGGWIMKVADPMVRCYRRPTGRKCEAHCAGIDDGALARWASAESGVSLWGEVCRIEEEDLGECIEIRWLPTRAERQRLTSAHSHPLQRAVWRMSGYEHDCHLIPPWAEVPTWLMEALHACAIPELPVTEQPDSMTMDDVRKMCRFVAAWVAADEKERIALVVRELRHLARWDDDASWTAFVSEHGYHSTDDQ